MQKPSDGKTQKDVEISVRDSFPASDPSSATATGGPRATPVQGGAAAPQVPDAKTLTRRFKDHESAKLALEELVRSVPLDREATQLEGSELQLRVPRDDAARIEALLQAA
ncbi:hypothetical protein [Falsiroseomonas tokyonensis]|uniref:Uncharacterized protein n=1 Tax=Falsiroseomonas tokyonensis TaxID=430521 RepID=A0ABV7BQP0_9PROT|nr:hypothetical protein [Falsiroseomonas tokyonensis]MBU8536984.1 hypothetical protein [Falsiroseomonas tokyonensis]